MMLLVVLKSLQVEDEGIFLILVHMVILSGLVFSRFIFIELFVSFVIFLWYFENESMCLSRKVLSRLPKWFSILQEYGLIKDKWVMFKERVLEISFWFVVV